MIDLCNQLDSYLLGELNVHEAATFEQHLKECCECQDGLARTREIEEDLRADFSSTNYHDQWASSVLVRLRGTELAGRPRRFKSLAWRSAAVIAATGLFVALWASSQMKPNGVHELSGNGQTATSPLPNSKTDSLLPHVSESTPTVSVHASAGYLSAKLSSNDQDFEIYHVLPQINSK